MINLKQFQKELEKRLSKLQIEDSKNKVQLVLSHVLGVKKLELVFVKNISFKNKHKVLKLIRKLEHNVPLQHLLKEVEFLNLMLYVNKNVLIPRNETELLADVVIKHIHKNYGKSANISVLNLCCGSGALGLSVANNTNATVTLSDVSNKALKVCKKNAKKAELSVHILHSDMFLNINSNYQLIVSNPPYIKSQDICYLDESVKNFEPLMALNGGEDGLEFYRIIAQQAPNFLSNGGEIFLEYGFGQEEEILKLLQPHFTDMKIMKDYNDINRFIYAKLKGEQC